MVDIKKTLLPELKDLVVDLAEDLLTRATSDAKIDAGLREAFQQIEKGGRTAQAFEVWRDDYLDQVAVAWVLACVFVRFLEDNQLIDECWLAGEGERQKLANDSYELYFREHSRQEEWQYFQHIFREVGKIPAAKDLFAEGKTPLWAVALGGDAARNLLKFWQERDGETGSLQRTFTVENGDTRFLGDLYQELSERAKKKFALLQTPVFVEELILDRTLTPAIEEFGLETVRMIDPTCGSGHFLLGSFARLFREWSKPEHTTGNDRTDAQKALDGVWGVDINPFAVAIARFRLTVAAVQACGIQRLKQAPGWNVHLTCGDSLLFGSKPGFDGERTGIVQQLGLFEIPDIYAVEDRHSLQQILGQGYHVVVGNPPYIIVRDRALNSAYRELYSTCHQKYSLAVPFTQRFWELSVQVGEGGGGCGYIGMITANSFMKREFGKKLIEEFFPKIDLTHVIDTSKMGHTLAGHGTPTVMLFGRNRKPSHDVVRAVLGIKGEPSSSEEGKPGLVWQSILSHIDLVGAQNEYISTTDVLRTTFNVHPWSIGGGGAAELKETIEDNANQSLSDFVDSIGITSFTLEDDVYIVPWVVASRINIDRRMLREMVVGDMLRDWACNPCDPAVFPYDAHFSAVEEDFSLPVFRYLWTYRTNLSNSKMFGGKTKVQAGLRWYEFGRLTHNKLRTPLSITLAFVATHNQFVLDRGGKVFKQSAPIIKLPADCTDDDHIALLGLLNSSVACFWMKNALHDKGGGGIGGGLATEFWEHFYEFTGTGLQRFPVPEQKPIALSRRLDDLARQLSVQTPSNVISRWCVGEDLKFQIDEAKQKTFRIRGVMIALQEELDWECYRYYALLPEDLCCSEDELPELALGQRAFEIVMARQITRGDLQTSWFERHGSTAISEIPSHWPVAYRTLVERRIKTIEANKEIALIERPENKRRWNTEQWEDQKERAIRSWLLDRLESTGYWPNPGMMEHRLQSTAQLADKASGDREFMEVAALYRERADFDLGALIAELVASESVPFLPVLRYKSAGLHKRKDWERTWDLQRQQDAGIEVGNIPLPRKYATTDFVKSDYWRLRGKLDVPKERWVSYPHCSTESDPSLVVGWAGWNHLEQATALIAYYDARKREGWDAKRLTPLLAGLDQLLPWIHQWYPEIDPEFSETAGKSYQTLLAQDAHELGLTMDDIRNWQPPATTARRRTTRTK